MCLKLLIATTDIIFLNLILGFTLMFVTHFGFVSTTVLTVNNILSLSLVFNFTIALACLYTRIYSDEKIEYMEKIFRSTLVTGLLIAACFSILLFSIFDIKQTFQLLSFLFLFLGVYAILSRFVLVYVYKVLPKRMGWAKDVFVIGHNDYLGNVIASFPHNHSFYTINTIPYYDAVDKNTKEEKVAQFKRYFEEVSKKGTYEVFLVNSPDVFAHTNDIIEAADFQCVKLNFVHAVTASIGGSSTLKDALELDLPVLRFHANSLSEMNNRFKKRIVDILISGFVIVFILSWLIPIVGLIIKIQSPGPIFFKQQRSGRNNTSFNCLKFRSMVVNTDSNSKQASKGDRRITPIGQFLRKTSLDEFPQFINVFLGQMSIIGPRPHMLAHTEHYSKLIQHYMVRHYVKPGISGWAQVNGYRGETNEPGLMAKRVEYDLEYMNNWSVMLDFKIIVMTAFNMAKGEKNAY
ncbi:exopolysaccharide biosynthesis polyprenyl glycosylphosphotransferase [Sphingobacterium rhinopitheci]|uniref:exopolysaccharide biosynthesis polyprenyl glycosylphosphotransferase n=1 Tax=Sphingobacterium rhinopitheci TaxID=2781960 RepID=UPI0021D414E2|nr:exopolysaccharide biosynthesis polyprenyl glycosylphosphotransferase [Sphingobacterium rhinopitheci]